MELGGLLSRPDIAIQIAESREMANLEEMLCKKNTQTIEAIADAAGLRPEQAESVVREVLPRFTKGFRSNLLSPEQAQELYSNLEAHHYEDYVNTPEKLCEANVKKEGDSILGEIFKSKETSRHIAQRVAQKTGVDIQIVQRMLPYIATCIMGALSKEMKGGGAEQLWGHIEKFLGAYEPQKRTFWQGVCNFFGWKRY